jgi:hypothetical protein
MRSQPLQSCTRVGGESDMLMLLRRGHRVGVDLHQSPCLTPDNARSILSRGAWTWPARSRSTTHLQTHIERQVRARSTRWSPEAFRRLQMRSKLPTSRATPHVCPVVQRAFAYMNHMGLSVPVARIGSRTHQSKILPCGNRKSGYELSARLCANCHVVNGTPSAPVSMDVPSFSVVPAVRTPLRSALQAG